MNKRQKFLAVLGTVVAIITGGALNIVVDPLKELIVLAVIILILGTAATIYILFAAKKADQEMGSPISLELDETQNKIHSAQVRLDKSVARNSPVAWITRKILQKHLQKLTARRKILAGEFSRFGGEKAQEIQYFLSKAGWATEPGDLIDLNGRAEFIIGKESRSPKHDRIVVHYITGRADTPHIDLLSSRVEEEKAGRGWLITERFLPKGQVNPDVSIGMDEEGKRLTVFRPNELFFRKLFPAENYFKWLRERATDLRVDDFNVPIEGRMLENGAKFLVDPHINQWKNVKGAKSRIAILADFGSGKTWFCWQYALHQLVNYENNPENEPIPLLITLNDYQQIFEPEKLIKAFFQKINDDIEGVDRRRIALDYELFNALNREGKFLIILDGLDEIVKPEIDVPAMLEKLMELALPGSNVILTSRRTLFGDSSEREKIIGEHNDFELIYLEPLDRTRVEMFIDKRDPHGWKQYLKKISAKGRRRLFELAKRPIMLSIILDVFDDVTFNDAVTIIALYDAYTTRLLKKVGRTPELLELFDRRKLMQRLAWTIYESKEDEIAQDELAKLLTLASEKSVINDLVTEKTGDIADARDLRTKSFLVRNGSGKYFFAHRSFLEYFVAQKLAVDLREGRKEPFEENLLSYEIIDFMRHLGPDPEMLYKWLEDSRIDENTPVGKGYFHSNILTLLNRADMLDNKSTYFKGRDFSRLHIFKADLTGADLEGCSFIKSTLDKVSVGGSRMVNADFTNASITSLNLGVRSAAKGVAFSRDGKYLASGNVSNGLVLFRKEGGRWSDGREKIGHTDSIANVTFSTDGKLVASSSFDRTVRVWKIGDKIGVEIPEHEDTVYDLEFLPVDFLTRSVKNDIREDYRYLFTASNCTIKVWRLKESKKEKFHAEEITSVTKHTDTVYKLAIDPAGKFLVSAGFDSYVGLWSIQREDDRIGLVLEALLPGHQNLVNGIAVSSDGRLLASSGNDGKIFIWSVKDRQIVATYPDHEGIVWDVAFSPSGNYLVSGSVDKTVKIWDVRTRAICASLAHPSNVWSVCFDPADKKERFVASGCFDNKVRVWDWTSRTCSEPMSMGDGAAQNIDCRGMKLFHAVGLSQFQELFLAERGALFEQGRIH